MDEKKAAEKFSEKLNIIANGMLFIAYIVTFILIIVFLCKILYYTKNEPKNRESYILNELSNYYTEGEFCYYNYKKFIEKGVIDNFGLPIKKIRKYAQALLSTLLISIVSLLIATILVRIGKSRYYSDNWYMCLGTLFYIFFVLAVILSIAFAIVFAHYYFKGNYDDFEEFSRCRYLKMTFKSDYDFIFKIKNGFKMPFVLILITEFFNFIKLVAESGNKY